jgi:type I restriction enzyme, S subunit
MKSKWPIKHLSEVAEIQMGQSPKGTSYNTSHDGVPLINGPVEFGETPFSRTKRTKFTTEPTKMCKVGDLILCVRGSTTGRMNIAGYDSCIGRGVASISSERYQDWISFFIHVNREAIYRLGSGATFPNVSGAMLAKIEIPIPPEKEQERIVSIMNEAFEGIDRAIANTEKNLANARELFESYLNDIFTQENNGWEWGSLSEITIHITDGDHQPPPKSDFGVPFITISNINKQDRTIDFSSTFKVSPEYFEKLKDNSKPRKGDLLYTVTGSYGIPVVVDHDMDFCFQRHIGLIRPSDVTDSRCLYYLLLSRRLLNQADECATGTAQKTVSLNGLRRFSVPKIPYEEQKIIVGKLDILLGKGRQLEAVYQQKLSALKELKQSILQKAFAGELTADTVSQTKKTAREAIAL